LKERILAGLALFVLLGVFGTFMHECGHYVACERLVGDTRIHFPLLTGSGEELGYIDFPPYVTPWKTAVVSLAGGWTAAAFFGLILLATDSLVGIVSCPLFAYEFVYGITEALWMNEMISGFNTTFVPVLSALIAFMVYSLKARGD